jgi:hypothetical protein
MNLPFGRNHPAYIKFVVSKSFAITSPNITIFPPLREVSAYGFQPQDHGTDIVCAKNADNPDIESNA